MLSYEKSICFIARTQSQFHLDLLKSMGFVQAVQVQNGDNVPNWKREIVDQRILEYKENPDDSRDWETLSNEIKLNYGVQDSIEY